MEKIHLFRRRDTLDEKRHLHNVETYLEEKRHLCHQRRDTFEGEETPVLEYRHFWRNRDTFWRERDTSIREKTFLVEKRHLSWCRGSFRGTQTHVS